MARKLAYLGSGIPALSATFIYREIFELERRGYPLSIYSLHREDPKGLSAEALPLFERTYYLLPVSIRELFSSHWHYAARSPLRYLRTIWKMLTPRHHCLKHRVRSLMHFGEGVVLATRMERDGITHIHSHYASQPTSVARVVHLLTSIPYSFSAHAHDIWHDRLQLSEKLAEARFVACCSRCGQRELTRQGHQEDSKKVAVVHHGIDIRRFVPPEPHVRKTNRILAVGRFESVKGFPNLVMACHLLRKEGIDFQCCIVGTGDEKDLVESMVKEHQLHNHVLLPGAVPQEQLLQYYHEATVFALPCIASDDGRHDGIPNVLVEAMATGLPVVSTSIGGISELVKNGEDGLLVAPGSQSELASTLKQLLQDSSLRQRLSTAARTKICAQFDNRKCIEPLIQLFEGECGIPASSLKTLNSY